MVGVMELMNKKVLIIGTGISGTGAAKLLLEAGAIPVLYDENENAKTEEIRGRLPEGGKAEIFVGRLPESIVEEICLAVPSPGVPVYVYDAKLEHHTMSHHHIRVHSSSFVY